MTNEEFMNKFENEIESYVAGQKIFNANRQELIAKVLDEFERKVDFIYSKKTVASLIQDELDTLNTCIRWICNNCSENKDQMIVVEYEMVCDLMELAHKYNMIKDMFILYMNKQTEVIVEGNTKVYFKYVISTNEERHENEILNFYNKLEQNLNFQEKVMDNFKKRLKSDDLLKYFFEIAKDIILEIRYLPHDIVLGDINLNEIYDVLSVLLAYSLMLKIRHTSIVSIEVSNMVRKIEDLTKLNKFKIKHILDLLTFDNDIQKIDAICTPLFKVITNNKEVDYIISPSLIVNSNFERNILVLLKFKFNSYFNKFNSIKEKEMINRINNVVNKYKNIEVSVNKKLYLNGSCLTDVDMVLYDMNTKTLLICELKDFLRGDNVVEHININGRNDKEGLKHGEKQIRIITDYFENYRCEFLDKCFNDKRMIVDTVYECIISKNNIGSKEFYNITILDELNFLDLIQREGGNLFNVVSKMKEGVFYPKIGIDYTIVKDRINLAGYEILFDKYLIEHKY